MLACSCGASLEAPDPLTFLRVGVDPAAEAQSLADALVEHGYVASFVEGADFVAVVARRSSPPATALRVVTWRGTALAVDAPDDSFPERRSVGVLAPPGDDFDLDGDGHEELVVAIEDLRRGATCLALTRIFDDGRVVEVPMPSLALHRDACVERLANVLGDARPEALVVARYPGLTTDAAPTVAFPLVARAPGFAAPSAAALRPYLASEAERRREELAAAREASEQAVMVRLGVELAALGRIAGRSVDEQLAALDDAVAGVELSPRSRGVLEVARQTIADRWP